MSSAGFIASRPRGTDRDDASAGPLTPDALTRRAGQRRQMLDLMQASATCSMRRSSC